MRKTAVGVVGMMLVLAVGGPAHAQFVVTDPGSTAAEIAGFVETVASVVAEIEELVKHYEQMKQEYNSITGIRNLGDVLYDQKFRDYLAPDWQKVYDAARDGGYAGLTGPGKSIADSERVFDACASLTVADERRACEARAGKPSQDKAIALEAFQHAKERLDQIESLMSKINDTPDPKSIQELQGRIAAEQAAIQNEQIKLSLWMAVADAEKQIQEQRAREIQARTWSQKNGIVAAPITFGFK
jgi:type IV secretion system protein VirB5